MDIEDSLVYIGPEEVSEFKKRIAYRNKYLNEGRVSHIHIDPNGLSLHRGLRIYFASGGYTEYGLIDKDEADRLLTFHGY